MPKVQVIKATSIDTRIERLVNWTRRLEEDYAELKKLPSGSSIEKTSLRKTIECHMICIEINTEAINEKMGFRI